MLELPAQEHDCKRRPGEGPAHCQSCYRRAIGLLAHLANAVGWQKPEVSGTL